MPRELLALKQGAEALRASRRAFAQHLSATFRAAALKHAAAGRPSRSRFYPRLITYFGNTSISEIDEAAIAQAAEVLYPGRGQSTKIRQVWTPVIAILRNAGDKRRFERPRTPKRERVRFIGPADLLRLAEKCSSHFRPLLLFMHFTGCQPSEAVHLKRQQIDLAQRKVRVPASSVGERRVVRLHSFLVTELRDLFDTLHDQEVAVFRRLDGTPYKNTGRSASAIKTAFAGACRRAKVSNYKLSDIRSTWAVWQLAVNRDLEALGILGGWRDRRGVAPLRKLSAADLDALRDSLREQQWDGELAQLSVVQP